jgi:integrase
VTRGELHFGGNTVKVWVDDSGEGITASSNRPLSTMKFREFAGKYEAEIVPQMKPASQASIKSVLGILNQSFGARRLSDIGTEEIQKFVTGSSYSPKTLRNQTGVMRMVWNKARAWGYVKHDPFEFLSMPRQPLTEARSLSVDEVRAIIRKTPEPFKTMLWILAETGIRGGELCGLYRSDVDARTIRIARSAFRKQIQTPKTVNAVREIAISGQLARHLEEFYDQSATSGIATEVGSSYRASGEDRGERQPSDLHSATFRAPAVPAALHASVSPESKPLVSLLFSMPDGRPWDNGEIVRRLKPVLGTGVGLHAFRHANKSLMQSLGVPEYLQDERMGHSKKGMGGRYTHSLPEDHRRWAEEIGRAICTENVLARGMGAD